MSRKICFDFETRLQESFQNTAKAKLKIYYTNHNSGTRFDCGKKISLPKNRTLLSKQPPKTGFLAFVPLGRNSIISPK